MPIGIPVRYKTWPQNKHHRRYPLKKFSIIHIFPTLLGGNRSVMHIFMLRQKQPTINLHFTAFYTMTRTTKITKLEIILYTPSLWALIKLI